MSSSDHKRKLISTVLAKKIIKDQCKIILIKSTHCYKCSILVHHLRVLRKSKNFKYKSNMNTRQSIVNKPINPTKNYKFLLNKFRM